MVGFLDVTQRKHLTRARAEIDTKEWCIFVMQAVGSEKGAAGDLGLFDVFSKVEEAQDDFG